MPRSHVALALCAILALPAAAGERPGHSPAQASYDYAQTVRNEVSASLKGTSDRASLQQAATRLEQLQAWLEQALARLKGSR